MVWLSSKADVASHWNLFQDYGEHLAGAAEEWACFLKKSWEKGKLGINML